MALSGKEKKALKAQGQRLEATIHFGKEGLNPNTIADLKAQLGKDALVKIKLPRHGELSRTDFSKQIAEACDAEFVSAIGFSTLIYRERSGIVITKKKHDF